MATARGLGIVVEPDDDFDPDEYADDGELGAGADDGDGMDDDPMGGPFDTYADTVFNPEATPEERSSALREAILTVIEERGEL